MKKYLIISLLIITALASCEKNEDESPSAFQIGFSAVSITPELVETEWEDRNGNNQFDGDVNRPAGDPADCGGSCAEPFNDLNGNGVFDAVWLAGFGMAAPATTVHDELWSRCFAAKESGKTVIFCTLDLIGYFHSEVEKIRALLVERGVKFDYLAVNSTHNHNGPDTMGMWGPNDVTPGTDKKYMDSIIEKTADAAEAAIAEMVPARIKIAAADTLTIEHLFEQPKHFRAGLIGDFRDPIITDETVTVAHFESLAHGRPLGTILHWANHPEMHEQEGEAITSDYPHYIRERLEEKIGGVAVYWTGPIGGLVTPIDFVAPVLDENGDILLRDGEPIPAANHSWEQLRYYGYAVADAAIGALEQSAEIIDYPKLSYKAHEFFLPVENDDFVLGFIFGILYGDGYDSNGGVLGENSQPVLGDRVYAKTETAYIKIGPLGALTIPGELFPELWKGVPEGVNDSARRQDFFVDDGEHHVEPYEVDVVLKPLVDAEYPVAVGLANDEIGYIVPKKDFYPDDWDGGHYGEFRSLGPSTEILIGEAVAELMADRRTNIIVEAGSPGPWPE